MLYHDLSPSVRYRCTAWPIKQCRTKIEHYVSVKLSCFYLTI